MYMVKKNKEYMSFYEDGKRYMQCKVCQSEYVQTGENTVAVTCSMCVQRICISQMSLEEMIPSLRIKKKTGRPPGWHFMNEFVDKKGNVFHKGKEQPELKGSTRIAVGYGKKRAGIFCVGGVCKEVPSSNGFNLTISSSF